MQGALLRSLPRVCPPGFYMWHGRDRLGLTKTIVGHDVTRGFEVMDVCAFICVNQCMYVRMHVCMDVCMRVGMCVYICRKDGTYVHVHICMYILFILFITHWCARNSDRIPSKLCVAPTEVVLSLKSTAEAAILGPPKYQKLTFTSTPQLPFKRPQIPSNRYHKALNRGTLGGLG